MKTRIHLHDVRKIDDRRRFVQACGLGGLSGLMCGSLPASAAPATGSLTAKPIKSCILLFYYGGPSHLDTFDPKPEAPAEIRGQYQSIETAVPGIRVTEHLPKVARIMDRLALVRSVHHRMRNHNSAAAEILTGREPAGGDLELLSDDPLGFPTLGSAVSYALADRAYLLPYVALPHVMFNVVRLPGQTPGMLGSAYDRFQVEGDPTSADFRIPALEQRDGLKSESIDRASLLRRLDGPALAAPQARWSAYQDRALRLVASEKVRRCFELGAEAPKTRDWYGRHRLGQSMLLARRLVEGGVNFVAVFDGMHNGQLANWDSHVSLFPRHGQLIPPSDQAYSALIEDLEARGLLESTLVVAVGEFGRTPKINGNAGRDHWPDCYTAVLAGGGVRGGALYGASDRIGAYPAIDPVTPSDLAATIYWRFGIDPSSVIRDQIGRPYHLAEGQPLERLFHAM